MPSLMNILLSVSTDRSSSFSLLKSFHQKCVRAINSPKGGDMRHKKKMAKI
jgi:hypothetical protein